MQCRSIGYLSFLPLEKFPPLIKKRSRVLGAPLFFLGICVCAYVLLVYFDILLRYSGNSTITTLATTFVIIELLALLIIYFGMIHHACKNNDVWKASHGERDSAEFVSTIVNV
jgi:hypothetical protein